MEIKSGQAYSTPSSRRSIQASQRSDRRDDEREADFSSREAAQKEQDRKAVAPAGQGSETRFFAIESREDRPVDPRLQVRATRERVRQTYSEQERSAARERVEKRADHEQQARDVQAEKRAQRNEARQPIDLIA